MSHFKFQSDNLNILQARLKAQVMATPTCRPHVPAVCEPESLCTRTKAALDPDETIFISAATLEDTMTSYCMGFLESPQATYRVERDA